MSALIWNVRGLNIKASRDVKEHIARIKLRKLLRFQRRIPTDRLYRTNHNHSEGESLSWDPLVWSLNFIASFDQQITFSAHNTGGLDILGTILYGANMHSQRILLWNDLEGIVFSLSFTLVGDCEKIQRIWKVFI